MAGVVVTMSGDEARLYRAMAKVVDQQTKMNRTFKDAGRASEEASGKAVAGHENARRAAEQYSTAVSGITTAAVLATSALEQMNAEQAKAIMSANQLGDANRRNLQISRTNADFQMSKAESDALASKYGVSRDVARDVYFQAESGGFQEAREFVVRASVVLDTSTAATIATKFPSMFQGVDAAEAIKLLGFSAMSSPLNVEQMANVAPTAAQGVAVLGGSMEEALGALSVLAARFKGNGDEAATAIKSFTASLGIDERFKGKGFIGAFETLQAMPEADRQKFLGSSQELNVAYTLISEEFGKIVAAVKANAEEMKRINAGGGTFMDQITIAENDPLVKSMRDAMRAAIRAEIANENISGVSGFRAEAAASYAQESMLLRGNLFQRTIDNQLKGFAEGIPFVGEFLSGFIPESSSGFIARNLANMGLNPETAGQVGAGVSMATTDPGGFLGLMQTMVASQIRAATTMENSAKAMQAAVEQSALQSNVAGARAMAAQAGQ